jgi:hypothetical protein
MRSARKRYLAFVLFDLNARRPRNLDRASRNAGVVPRRLRSAGLSPADCCLRRDAAVSVLCAGFMRAAASPMLGISAAKTVNLRRHQLDGSAELRLRRIQGVDYALAPTSCASAEALAA